MTIESKNVMPIAESLASPVGPVFLYPVDDIEAVLNRGKPYGSRP